MVLLYQDETHVRAYQSLHATWSQRGSQRQIPTYGHHASVTIFGTVNAQTGEVVHQTASSCKQEDFLSFLSYVLKQYEDKFVVMVTDNARIHKSKLVQDFLHEQKERLMLVYLPPYSPNLNPIERLWKWLKQQVIANRFHPTQASIKESVQDFLSDIAITPQAVLRRLGLH
ncbi:IS630 family transposase [Bacillus cytotoxicus]|uniref:IS630 family transposase n=1 Tax=Bacillus cytotoxicus TaxID=580165 RepID=A0ACC6A2T4_9BACI|nr:IS630 family transposase [Bacillus cytotoxicus]